MSQIRAYTLIGAAVVLIATGPAAVSAAPTASPARPNGVYAGTVGNKPITMLLVPGTEPGEVSGLYRYGKRQKPLSLKGRLDAAGGFTLTETDSGTEVTGSLAGKLAGACLEGSWSAPDGSRALPWKACEFDKREALARAVGSYSLRNVEGVAGANAMIAMEKRRGRWTVGGTSIQQGMRQTTPFHLENVDRALLNSLRVVVGKDLSVELRVGERVVRRIPFQNEMDYALAKDDTAWVYGERMDRQSAATTFVVLHLFLCAVAKVDLPEASGSFYFDEKPRLLVTYVPGLDEFDVKLGMLELTFVRAKR